MAEFEMRNNQDHTLEFRTKYVAEDGRLIGADENWHEWPAGDCISFLDMSKFPNPTRTVEVRRKA